MQKKPKIVNFSAACWLLENDYEIPEDLAIEAEKITE
jgi:hypothetical protein